MRESSEASATDEQSRAEAPGPDPAAGPDLPEKTAPRTRKAPAHRAAPAAKKAPAKKAPARKTAVGASGGTPRKASARKAAAPVTTPTPALDGVAPVAEAAAGPGPVPVTPATTSVPEAAPEKVVLPRLALPPLDVATPEGVETAEPLLFDDLDPEPEAEDPADESQETPVSTATDPVAPPAPPVPPKPLPDFASEDAVDAGPGPVKRLTGSPSTASTLVRAALPFRKGNGRSLPGTVLRLEDVASTSDRVADYARVTGGSLGTTLPALYPHMLGFPLQMALMGDRHFPFPAIGLVHVTNDAVQRHAIPVGAPVDVEVHAAGPVPHRRGVTIDMVTRVMLDGELAWFSTSTYLRRGPSELPKAETPTGEKVEAPPLPQRSIWRIPADQGRQYAAVSGDANPIHMSGLSAKAFGFPRAIAHGMWTAARVASGTENLRDDVWRMQVQFRAPILLPSTVTFHTDRTAEELAFEVRGKRDRLHLTGSFT